MKKNNFPFYYYLLAAFVFFIFWLVAAFPHQAIEARLHQEIRRLSEGRYELKTKAFETSVFGSVEFDKLKILENTPQGKKMLFRARHLELETSLWALFSGALDLDFYVQSTQDGEIEGRYWQEEGKTYLELDLEAFPLQDLPWIKQAAQLDLKGELSGQLNLTLQSNRMHRGEGEINLDLGELKLVRDQGSEAQGFQAMLDLPTIQLSGAEGSKLKIEVQQDNWRLQSLSLRGGDLDLDLKGRVRLARGFHLAEVNLDGKFKVQKPKAFENFLPLIEGGKRPDGSYPLKLKISGKGPTRLTVGGQNFTL